MAQGASVFHKLVPSTRAPTEKPRGGLLSEVGGFPLFSQLHSQHLEVYKSQGLAISLPSTEEQHLVHSWYSIIAC